MTDFVEKARLTELENKIPDISDLSTKTAFTAVENEIPNVTNLVNKTDYNTKITEVENKLNNHNHDKYYLILKGLITKTDFDAKLSNLNRKITSNKTKHLLVENESNQLKSFDSSYFIGKSHFDEDGTQNYLVFQPMSKYFKLITITLFILSWQSKGLSN